MIYRVFTSVLTITTNDILSVYKCVNYNVLTTNDILSVYKCVNYNNKVTITITTNDILSVYKCVNYNNKWYIECLQVC